MRSLFCALGLALTVSPAWADGPPSGGGYSCEAVEYMAGSVMSWRQDGDVLSEVLEKHGKSELVTRLAIEAYSLPRYRDSQSIKHAVIDFKNDAYLSCIKERKSD